VYLKTKSDKLSPHWAVLLGNELYCYKDRSCEKHILMHTIVGTFLQEEEKTFDNNFPDFFPVKILLSAFKSRVLYFASSAEQTKWTNSLRYVQGAKNLDDVYTMGKVLGKGQFGEVHSAIHKKTNDLVAIKTVRKKDMKMIEVLQMLREIDVLKACQHPNIIRLIDVFENASHYYIVLEHMEGKDLFDYLRERKF
jgi:calcium-dependent protein kinase